MVVHLEGASAVVYVVIGVSLLKELPQVVVGVELRLEVLLLLLLLLLQLLLLVLELLFLLELD